MQFKANRSTHPVQKATITVMITVPIALISLLPSAVHADAYINGGPNLTIPAAQFAPAHRAAWVRELRQASTLAARDRVEKHHVEAGYAYEDVAAIEALTRIAAAQANAEDFAGAFATVEQLPLDWKYYRYWAWARIARAQARAGMVAEAKVTLAKIIVPDPESLKPPKSTSSYTEARFRYDEAHFQAWGMGQIAIAQAEQGDASGVLATLQALSDTARSNGEWSVARNAAAAATNVLLLRQGNTDDLHTSDAATAAIITLTGVARSVDLLSPTLPWYASNYGDDPAKVFELRRAITQTKSDAVRAEKTGADVEDVAYTFRLGNRSDLKQWEARELIARGHRTWAVALLTNNNGYLDEYEKPSAARFLHEIGEQSLAYRLLGNALQEIKFDNREALPGAVGVAEAYAAIGDTTTARQVYARVLAHITTSGAKMSVADALFVYQVATSEAEVGLFADARKTIERASSAKPVPNNLDAQRGDIFPQIATKFALGGNLAGAREIVALLPTPDARDQALRDVVIALLQTRKDGDAIKIAAGIQRDSPRAQALAAILLWRARRQMDGGDLGGAQDTLRRAWTDAVHLRLPTLTYDTNKTEYDLPRDILVSLAQAGDLDGAVARDAQRPQPRDGWANSLTWTNGGLLYNLTPENDDPPPTYDFSIFPWWY